MKSFIGLFGGIISIVLMGFLLINWQTGQTGNDRIQSTMTTSIQQSVVKVEDYSQRTNTDETKTLRVTSLQDLMDSYFKLYNENVSNTTYKEDKSNTSFNFYLADGDDITQGTFNLNKDSGVDIIVKNGKIETMVLKTKQNITNQYFIYTTATNESGISGKVKEYTSKTGVSPQVNLNQSASTLDGFLKLTTSVNIKMIKVQSSVGGQTYNVTTALSLKKSTANTSTVNKLSTLEVPYKVLASDKIFVKNVDIQDSLNNSIDVSNFKYSRFGLNNTYIILKPNSSLEKGSIEYSDTDVLSSTDMLTGKYYYVIYVSTDTNTGNVLKVSRKISVDQNNPLIDSPSAQVIYIGQSSTRGATAYEMRNQSSDTTGAWAETKGKDISDLLTQNLSASDLGTAGTYEQTLSVTDPDNGKSSTLKRNVSVKLNQPTIEAPSSFGTIGSTEFTLTSIMSGVFATSPVEGSITNLVKAEIVDPVYRVDGYLRFGTYTLKYTVTAPSGGLTATATSKVTIR